MSARRIYVFGEKATIEQGENPGFVRVYNPLDNQWTYGADSPTDRYCFGVTAVNDTFYVIGGHTYTFPGDFAPTPVNEQYTPLGYGTPDPSYDNTPPELTLFSPQNTTYYTTNVTLAFAVNEETLETKYCLDGVNVTISGNTTLSGLSYGVHSLTVFAQDSSGNIGSSETIIFTIADPEPFPTTLVATASGASVAVVGLGLLLYFRRRNNRAEARSVKNAF
jgi:hypothetical protein